MKKMLKINFVLIILLVILSGIKLATLLFKLINDVY